MNFKIIRMTILVGLLSACTSTFASEAITVDPLNEQERRIYQHFYPEGTLESYADFKPHILKAIQTSSQDNVTFCKKILFSGFDYADTSLDNYDDLITTIRTIVASLDFNKLNFTVKTLTKDTVTFPALIFEYDGVSETDIQIEHDKNEKLKRQGKPLEYVSLEENKRQQKLPPYLPAASSNQEQLIEIMTLRSVFKGHSSMRNFNFATAQDQGPICAQQ